LLQKTHVGDSQEESKESIYQLMGETKIQTVSSAQIGVTSDSNFLLLDMRDKDEYVKWHIKEAYSFPLMLLNQDKTIPELFRFKNKEDKMIIVYVNDERTGIIVGQSMVDRGYENTYLLTGGIEKFIEDYSSLVEGTNIPQFVSKPTEAKKR